MFCSLENPALPENLDFPIEFNPINLEWVDFNVQSTHNSWKGGNMGIYFLENNERARNAEILPSF